MVFDDFFQPQIPLFIAVLLECSLKRVTTYVAGIASVSRHQVLLVLAHLLLGYALHGLVHLAQFASLRMLLEHFDCAFGQIGLSFLLLLKQAIRGLLAGELCRQALLVAALI